jgi:polar amino acid transport system substrate-binding protein
MRFPPVGMQYLNNALGRSVVVKRVLLSLFVLILVASSSLPALGGKSKIVLTSLEWPPYTGAGLPGQGMTSEVVRAAFEAVGYTVEIRFLPWKRALADVWQDPDVVGAFPEYASPDRQRSFLLSDVIGISPVGLVHLKSRPLHWRRLQDLSGLSIGTVQGYANTEDFDRMARRRQLLVEPAVSDLLNLRKILAGHLALAVADVNLFRFQIMHDRRLWRDRQRLQVNPHLLGVNTLHVCFLRGREGAAYLRDFNEGLRRISVSSIERHYLERIFPEEERLRAVANEKGSPPGGEPFCCRVSGLPTGSSRWRPGP